MKYATLLRINKIVKKGSLEIKTAESLMFCKQKSNLFRSCFYFEIFKDYFLKPSSAIIALYLAISLFLR